MLRHIGTYAPLYSGLLLLSGCAINHDSLLSQWEEDDPAYMMRFAAPETLETQTVKITPRPKVTKPIPIEPKVAQTISGLQKQNAEPIDPEQLAADLEIGLLHFTSELKMLSSRVQKRRKRTKQKKSKQWPKVIQLLWGKALDELQSGLAIGDDELMPKRVLLQAHVTTAAEKDITERKFGECPEALGWRIKDLHQKIHRLLQRNAVANGEIPNPPLTVGQAPKLEWPVSPQIYTSMFGFRRDPINGRKKFHAGIDLGADHGVIVSSAALGRVIHSGWAGGYGRMVVIQHIGGYQTVYAHLGKILVPIGSKVDSGTPLGLVGSSGRSTGPHLHFEVRFGGRPIDPLKLLRGGYAHRKGKHKERNNYLSAAKSTGHDHP